MLAAVARIVLNMTQTHISVRTKIGSLRPGNAQQAVQVQCWEGAFVCEAHDGCIFVVLVFVHGGGQAKDCERVAACERASVNDPPHSTGVPRTEPSFAPFLQCFPNESSFFTRFSMFCCGRAEERVTAAPR